MDFCYIPSSINSEGVQAVWAYPGVSEIRMLYEGFCF